MVLILSESNKHFFSEFFDEIKDFNTIIGYSSKKKFLLEKKSSCGSFTRFFKTCTGTSYDITDASEELLKIIKDRIKNNQQVLPGDDKNEVGQEFFTAMLLCDKMQAIIERVVQKKKIENNQLSTEFQLQAFEALNLASSILQEPPTLLLCKNQCFDKALELIDQGASITDVKDYYNPLLKAASMKGQYTRAIELIARGADPLFADTHLGAILREALISKNTFVSERLINAGAPLNESSLPEHLYPLYYAISKDFPISCILLMLQKGALVDQLNPPGKTALALALEKGVAPAVLALLDAGADPNQIIREGKNCFHYVLERNYPLIALKLLEKGFPLSFVDPTGQSLLHLAAAASRLDIVRILLEKNIAVSRRDRVGNTALHTACIQGNAEIAQMIIHSGGDLSLINEEQRTPFQAALASKKFSGLDGRTKIISFFSFFFSDFPEVTKRLDRYSVEGFIDYFKRNPSLIIKKRISEGDPNPLEIPFLLQSPQLAKALASSMTLREFSTGINTLTLKYKHTPTDRVDLSIYEINPIHLRQGAASVEIPTKPAGYEVRQLLTLFDQINFSNPNEDNYQDTSAFSSDTGTLSSSELRASLRILVERIEQRIEYLGTPPSGTAELRLFYTTIENAITNTLKKLHEGNDPLLKAKTVIEFVRAAGYCGGKYYATAYEQFSKIVLGVEATFENTLFSLLANQRETILRSLIPSGAQSVHDFNQLMYALGKELGIPGASMMTAIRDRYGAAPNKENSKKQFFELYTPYAIISEWLEPRISQDGDLKNKFIDWCKANVPAEWGKGHFGPIKLELAELQTKKASPEEISTFLTKHDMMLSPGMTVEEAIEDERIMAFIATEVLVDMNAPVMRFKKKTIAYMLFKLNVLTQIRFVPEPVLTAPANAELSLNPSSLLVSHKPEPPTTIFGFVQEIGSYLAPTWLKKMFSKT